MPLAGGRLLETEFGDFYSPNITPDKETGIGSWSDDDFINAVQHGISPKGSNYYPTFPFTAYGGLTTSDVLAIKTYLFSQKPIKQANKNHNLKWYLNRLSITFWNLGNSTVKTKETTEELTRGSYLINNLGHCGECHTPRNLLGLLVLSRHLKGNDDLETPNISNTENGIKDWSDDELKELFQDGLLQDGDYLSGHMAEVVEYSTAFWNKADLKAAIAYLRAQP